MIIGSADATTRGCTVGYHTRGERFVRRQIRPTSELDQGDHNITSLPEHDINQKGTSMQKSIEEEPQRRLRRFTLTPREAAGVRAEQGGTADTTDSEQERDMVQTDGAEVDGRSARSGALSVAEAAEYLGLSLSRAYEAFRRGGELESCAVRVGTRVLVSRARLERVLNGEHA
jgi:excisionase family DNA binding protein